MDFITQWFSSRPGVQQGIEHDCSRKLLRVWMKIRFPQWPVWISLLRLWYALRHEGRSFVGHTRTLLAKKHWGVDYGPLYESLPDEHLILNKRTDACIRGTQDLAMDYPWASMVDRQIFLRGFDAGEQYALLSTGTPAPELAVAP